MSTLAHHAEPSEMDGLIKFLLAVVLAVIPFVINRQMSFMILILYLLLSAVILKIKTRTLLLSAASYGVIVVFPYLFGLLINYVIGQMGTSDSLMRLFQLFIIWYVSILYFQTTPMKTVLGLLDKFFYPLRLIGVPVQDYLKLVMCIVLELKEKGSELKTGFLENTRSTLGQEKGKLRHRFKAISHIIVSLLVNSFEKIDTIQCFVEQAKAEELFHYSFGPSKKDAAAVFSLVLLILAVFFIERGYWPIT